MRFFLSCLLITMYLVSGFPVEAQEQKAKETGRPARSSRLAIGFSLETIQDDFGLELDLTTPYFAGKMMAFRVR